MEENEGEVEDVFDAGAPHRPDLPESDPGEAHEKGSEEETQGPHATGGQLQLDAKGRWRLEGEVDPLGGGSDDGILRGMSTRS